MAKAGRIKSLSKLVRSAASDFVSDTALRLAAAISFYTIFALSPLLIIVIAIAGFIFGDEAARGEISGQFEGLVGPQGRELVETVIQNADKPGGGVVGTTFGVLMLLVAATGLFGELKDALNRIWEVEAKPGRGIINMLRTRLFSFAMVMVVAFLLVVSLTISALLAGLGGWLESRVAVAAWVLQALNFVISFGVLTALFAAVYKILPDVTISWREVLFGGALTALLFTIGKYAIGVYLGHAAVGGVYGAAGSLAVVLIWIYYSTSIFLFGAELTQAHATMYGKGIRPRNYARRIDWTEKEEAAEEKDMGAAGRTLRQERKEEDKETQGRARGRERCAEQARHRGD